MSTLFNRREFEWQISFFYSVKWLSVRLNSDNGYLIGGISNKELLVIKVDINGTKMWNLTYNNNELFTLNSIKKSIDGGYIVLGKSRNVDKHGQYADQSVELIKLDDKGNILCNKTYIDDYNVLFELFSENR